MPTDPNIILGINQDPGLHANDLVSMFDFAQQVKQVKQQDATQNALKQIFTDPSSVDESTGLPNAKAIRGVMAVNPDMGIKLQDASLEAQAKKLQIQHSLTDQGKTRFGFMAQTAGAGYDAYQDAKDAGKSESDAVAAGQAARNAAAKNGGGIVGDDVVDGITGTPFDPAGAKALAATDKEWATLQHQRTEDKNTDRRLDQGDKRLDQEDKRSDQQHDAEMARLDQSQSAKWQVLTDPAHKGPDGKDIPPMQYRYNPETGESTTLDAKAAYSPAGAQKLGGGTTGNPRSAASAYIQKYMTENPGATSDDIAKAASTFAVEQSEGRTVGTRSGAADVAANEVSVFAKQALDASKAVPRPDLKALTGLIQAGETQDSDPDLQKLLIATDALVNARARAISPSGSPHVSDQIEGRKLLSTAIGKLGYEAGVAQFQKEAEGVLESTRQSKAGLQGGSKPDVQPAQAANGISTPATKADYDALKSGTHYSKPGDAPGTYRVKP